MSLRSDTVYWVVCDGCGERPEDGEGYQPVYDTAEIATRYSRLGEVDGQLLCDDCKGTAAAKAHGTSEGHGPVAS